LGHLGVGIVGEFRIKNGEGVEGQLEGQARVGYEEANKQVVAA